MDKHEIESIFSQEYTKFYHSVSTLNSLIIELQDVSQAYSKLKDSFSSMIKNKAYTSDSIKDILELHLSLVVRITDINKEISDILYPSTLRVSE